LIGAGLFLLFGVTRGPTPDEPSRIVVDAGQVAQLTSQFKRTWMRPPTDAELAGLIDNHVRDEVYYREALAMGLDQNDLLIRRRMRQKMEFILEDLSAASEPDEQALIQFLNENADRFRLEPQMSFHQVYLNPDKNVNLEKRAARILEDLRAGVQPEMLGDTTLMARKFELSTLSFIARSFGDSFAEDLVKLPPEEWTGPIYSALGGHIVRVDLHKESRLPELEEIRAQVEGEYLDQRRRELKDIAYQQLRQNYQVIIEPSATMGTAIAAEPPEEVEP
jgi:hypothetical protein